jgi:RHS repeat-associated protein
VTEPGSSAWITDGSGNACTERSRSVNQHLQYLPFGESFIDQRTNHDIRFKFTTKEEDSETGYQYFGARYYKSDLSIWLRVDLLADKYPSMSPYMYTAGNPVMLVDPDGNFPFPVVFLLFGFLTYPTMGYTPSLDYSLNQQAMKETKELQDMWLLGTLLGSGYSAGGSTLIKQLVSSLVNQFTTQIAINTTHQLMKGNFDVTQIINNSLKSLDFSDAAISKLNLGIIAETICKAAIDITPDEASLLGFNKDITHFTVDMVANAIAGKKSTGKYSKIIDKINDVITTKTSEFLKDSEITRASNTQFELLPLPIDESSTLGQGRINIPINLRKNTNVSKSEAILAPNR